MKLAIIGGHLTPALSVIEALPNDAKVIYIGRKHSLEGDKALSLEYQAIYHKGIEFVDLNTGRVQRKLTLRTVPSLTKVPYGFLQSYKILRKIKPDVVLGFGGYVSFPVIVAAKALKIPVVIHEQTLEAGAANKLCAKFADRICISFQSSYKFFPKDKTILTGNPIRNTITAPGKKFLPDASKPIIYVTGGSQGSHFINQIIYVSIGDLLDKYIVVHQTGGAKEFNDYDKLEILRNGMNSDKKERYILSKFFSPEEVGGIMKAASLIISRAGINSVSEIMVLKKPSILIPLPGGQRNEQLKNANFLKKSGLGEVIEQKDLTPQGFLILIKMMMENLDKYKLTDTATHFPKNSAEKIIQAIYEILPNSH